MKRILSHKELYEYVKIKDTYVVDRIDNDTISLENGEKLLFKLEINE